MNRRRLKSSNAKKNTASTSKQICENERPVVDFAIRRKFIVVQFPSTLISRHMTAHEWQDWKLKLIEKDLPWNESIWL